MSLKKWSRVLSILNVHCDYSKSLTLSNVGEHSWSWGADSQVQLEKESLFTSSTKRGIRHFHVVVVQWRQCNVQKSVMHVQNCCFSYLPTRDDSQRRFLAQHSVATLRHWFKWQQHCLNVANAVLRKQSWLPIVPCINITLKPISRFFLRFSFTSMSSYLKAPNNRVKGNNVSAQYYLLRKCH